MELTNEKRLAALKAFYELFKDTSQTYNAEVKHSMLDDGKTSIEVRVGKKRIATIYYWEEVSTRCTVVLEDSPRNVCEKLMDEGVTLDDLVNDEAEQGE